MATTSSSRRSEAQATASPPASSLTLARALGRLTALLATAIVVGLLIGHPWPVIALALAAALGWHFYNLYRLEHWLNHGPPLDPPNGIGIWSVLFDQLYRLKRTEWHRKRRLTAMLRQFRQATAALPDGAVVLNRAGQVLWFNASAGRLLGLNQRQDIGNPITNVVRNPALGVWLRGRSTDEALPLTSTVDESVRLNLRLVPYTPEERLLIVRDVTHLHRLEQVRKDFVANASHELRTPLTVIAGYLETLDEDKLPEWSGAVAEMLRQSRRMQSIVEDLLTLSRLDATDQPAPREPVHVAELADTVVRDARALSDGGHEFTMELDRTLQLLGDARDLRSALSNLVVNAVRYTQRGGAIRVHWFAEDGRAVFQVSDNGPGIPAAHIPRLTERFYRVSPSRSRDTGGTGLGLSIVKHVLNLHQAELKIESAPGEGATFTCVFPADRVVRKAA